MSKFEKTRWADGEFSRNYIDEASIYVPYRQKFLEVSISLYSHFIDTKINARVLDLGCGDGFFMQKLLESHSPTKITMVDGSIEMLEAAKKRLGNKENIDFIKSSFQDLLMEKSVLGHFHFIFSSLAIHHLTFKEKEQFFTYIYHHLIQNGCFVLFDVVSPPSVTMEKWYFSLWRQWIKDYPSSENNDNLLGIPKQYKESPDNMPDSLYSQLDILKEIGFKEVDCYFKYGIFALYGGFKS